MSSIPSPTDLIPEDDPDAEPDPRYTFPGNFLDLRTLAFALTNEGHTLEIACKAFGVKHGKIAAPNSTGVISASYIDYCRRDVLATSGAVRADARRVRTPPDRAPPTLARSPAAIAKAYLDAMGIMPSLDQHADFPRELLGHAMIAYFGGRDECRIRRTPVPVVLRRLPLHVPDRQRAHGPLAVLHRRADRDRRRTGGGRATLVETVTVDDLLSDRKLGASCRCSVESSPTVRSCRPGRATSAAELADRRSTRCAPAPSLVLARRCGRRQAARRDGTADPRGSAPLPRSASSPGCARSGSAARSRSTRARRLLPADRRASGHDSPGRARPLEARTRVASASC